MGSRCVLQREAFLSEGIFPDLSTDFAVGVSLVTAGCLVSGQLLAVSIDFQGEKVQPKYCLLPSIATDCCLSVPHAQGEEGWSSQTL